MLLAKAMLRETNLLLPVCTNSQRLLFKRNPTVFTSLDGVTDRKKFTSVATPLNMTISDRRIQVENFHRNRFIHIDRAMSGIQFNDSSSAASKPEINTVIFEHCILSGSVDHRILLSEAISKDFQVEAGDSIFHKKYKYEEVFRAVLYEKIKKILLDEKVKESKHSCFVISKRACDNLSFMNDRWIRNAQYRPKVAVKRV